MMMIGWFGVDVGNGGGVVWRERGDELRAVDVSFCLLGRMQCGGCHGWEKGRSEC